MDWSKGYSARYTCHVVDTGTWRDTEEIKITGGTVKRTPEGLMQSADLSCVGYEPGLEQWVRVYLDAVQEGSNEHVAIFTGLATSPGWEYNGKIKTETLTCYSVLKPAEDILLPRGFYIPTGTNGAEAAKELLAVCPCPVDNSKDSPSLQAAIVAEENETNLSMVWKILEAINWRIMIYGDGSVMLTEKAADAVAELGETTNDAVEMTVSIDRDLFSCPNVFRAVMENLTAVARDERADSGLSVQNRGREIWAEETNVVLNTGESIAQYAARRLAELQTVAMTATYTRRYNPDIMPGDIIRMNYPTQQLEGLFVVTSQDIALGFNAATAEEVQTL